MTRRHLLPLLALAAVLAAALACGPGDLEICTRQCDSAHDDADDIAACIEQCLDDLRAREAAVYCEGHADYEYCVGATAR